MSAQNVQHLSDEAVAAHADGVLSGHARERARRHVEECAECRTAVRVQREAAFALRAAPAPALPTDLMARLCSLPQTTPISTLPTAVTSDGSTVLAARAGSYLAPMAGLVPAEKSAHRRVKPIATAVAVAALAGALSTGSVASRSLTQSPANGHVANQPGDGSGSDRISQVGFRRP